jgi:hypothetical protein
MKVSHRIAIMTTIARREVRRLAATAEKRATEAESPRAAPSFRPLCEAEASFVLCKAARALRCGPFGLCDRQQWLFAAAGAQQYRVVVLGWSQRLEREEDWRR